MSSVEKMIRDNNAEADALKVAFEMSAMNIPVKTKELTFNTSKNEVSISMSGQPTYTYADYERTILTFNTDYGQNTLAQLELTTNGEYPPVVRRLAYSGGARWMIMGAPRFDGGGDWVATTFNFTVHSAIEGTLSAKMVWQ